MLAAVPLRRRRVWLAVAALALLVACSGTPSSEQPPVDAGRDAGGAGPDGAAADGGPADGELPDDGAPDGGTADGPPGDAEAPDGLPPGLDSAVTPPGEMLLFDGADRQFTYADNGFHALISPGDTLPASNWLTPINYHEGEFQIRYVVQSPAAQSAGQLQTCLWTMGDDGDGRNYFPESCSAQVSHTGPGTSFNTRLVPSTWWMNEGVALDYSHPERFLIRVVLRGASGCNVTRYSVSNSCWDQWPSYENMKFRVTIVMVGQGRTFSGWSHYP